MSENNFTHSFLFQNILNFRQSVVIAKWYCHGVEGLVENIAINMNIPKVCYQYLKNTRNKHAVYVCINLFIIT